MSKPPPLGRPRRPGGPNAAWRRCVLAGLLALAAAPAPAGIATRMPPPRPGTPRPISALSGMSCVVDTGNVSGIGYGYRDVRFRFKSPTPTTGDQQLSVRFYASSLRGQRSQRRASVQVERDGVLPGGAAAAEIVLPTPYFDPWAFVWWDVWVDGVHDPTLSLGKDQALSHPVSDRQETLSVISLLWGGPGNLTSDKLTLQPTDLLSIFLTPLPTDWMGYTPHDAVLADIQTLTELKTEQPEQFALLRRWVASGGALWIAEVSGDGYAQIDKLLGTNTPPFWTTADQPPAKSPADGWSWVYLRDDSARQPKSVDELLQDKNDGESNPRRGDRAWFAERRIGFGTAVAFLPNSEARRDASRFAGQRFPDTRPNASGENNPKQNAAINHLHLRNWTKRHGLAPGAANDDFSSHLVPGVGTAPVIEFQVLITLFAIVAGPVNYWLLKRRQRAHLMVLTVPILATGITLALLLYALLSDGFGTKVRVREITLLDQTAGEHTTWGRLSYYSGLAPSDGFNLPTECAMYPIVPGWNDLGLAAGSAAPREITWTDDGQHLRGGWLRSRATTQYLQVLSAPTEKHLEINATGDGPSVTNLLGADLDWLLVVDQDSRLLHAEGVGDGREAQLKPAEKDGLSSGARIRVIEAEPFPPEGLSGEDTFDLVEREKRMVRKRLQRELNLNYAAVRVGENQLNTLLDELIGLTGDEPLRLPPRSYLAFAKSAVGVELGIDGARQLGGFHVVIGRW